MELTRLLDELGYSDSPHFLRRGTSEFATAPDFGHIFRNAVQKPCRLEGVYTLRRSADNTTEPLVPVVYVCEAETEDAAKNVHRLVWNQDVVPFVLVYSPHGVRLYSGFCYQPRIDGVESGVLKALTQFNAISEIVESFHADAIDSGKLWRDWGRHVTPHRRVDWKLLESLKKLDNWLRNPGQLDKEVSHALIGKYVYLHYLRDRKILSSRKLNTWGLDAATIFGRAATKEGLAAVTEQLDDWLNGSVFPLELRGRKAPSDEHITRVAATFQGDEIVRESSWQLHLDFQAYDFSYIPIETLSVIYEQFLHAPEEDGKTTKGKEAAAYYTPIPVVNFILGEMEARKPLQRSMTIGDFSCGSGAFLVQCYRRLIEKEFPATKKRPTPTQLRALLQEHIFGVDNDADACSVTELSLILTLLDYLEPPDLENKPQFKLPTLRDENIFHTNFFALSKPATAALAEMKFDWIVGNPPWKDLKPADLIPQDEPVWAWMSTKENKKTRPCGDNEVAQAFLWRSTDFLAQDGVAGLLLPAMALFEDPSKKFRSALLQSVRVSAVANFANLAEVLFAGRSRVPAAAFFFGHRDPDLIDDNNEFVSVFSPLVANQEVTRAHVIGKRNEIWSLVVNSNEIRELPLHQIATGNGLPWKLSMWGSASGDRLLKRISAREPALGELEDQGLFIVAEGPPLVAKSVEDGPNKTRRLPEVVGQNVLDVKRLAKQRRVFAFPRNAFVTNANHFGHLRRGIRGVAVCQPPHVVVSAARNFAVYSDEYLIVPPRQIGIVSQRNNADLLKALSLYLSSDFAFYHQFLTATELGVKRDRATLRALRAIPVPLMKLRRHELKPWIELHLRLVKTLPSNVQEARLERRPRSQMKLNLEPTGKEPKNTTEALEPLFKELNDLVFDTLGLDARERALVHDLVHVGLELNDGKLGSPAVRLPKINEMKVYAIRLKSDLDSFIGEELAKRHHVGIVFDDLSAMVRIDLIADKQAAREILVIKADSPTSKQLEKTRNRLLRKHSQWVYFDRNLRVFEGTKTFVFKPMQRFHWTESQAMLDASEIIAETLQSEESSE